MFGLGLPELILIVVIIMLLFGTSRLAGLGKGLGQAIRGFKEEMKDDDKSGR
jgi:sec-independent protein translocase protein TatA